MGRTNNSASQGSTRKRRPAETPEARENQLIALAMDRAEERLRDGTASNQLICQFIKMGSSRERLEKDMAEEKMKLLEAQTAAIQSQKRVEELMEEALKAMKTYTGNTGDRYDKDIF